MADLFVTVIVAAVDLLKKALAGDLTAAAKLKTILSPQQATELERAMDEAAADAKFGPSGG